jgi:hypothetical protein
MVKFRSWAAVALAIALAFAVTACGGDEEEKAPKLATKKPAAARAAPQLPMKVDPGPTEGAIRYSGETESGDEFKAQIGGEVSLPSEFGSDLPAYPGAVAQSAIETTAGIAIAALESDASADDIIDFYREQLSNNGWSIEGTSDLGRGSLLTATKGERRAMVNAEDMDEGTRFTLSLGAGSSN